MPVPLNSKITRKIGLTLRSTSSRASGLVLISIFSFAAASSIRSIAFRATGRCIVRPGPDYVSDRVTCVIRSTSMAKQPTTQPQTGSGKGPLRMYGYRVRSQSGVGLRVRVTVRIKVRVRVRVRVLLGFVLGFGLG